MTGARLTGPRPVLPARQVWPLFDAAASRAVETCELARHPPGTLMRQAGRSVARLALALAPHARRIWVAAGPGGNGGDGLHAAADLAERGRQVVVTLCRTDGPMPPDAQQGLERARAAAVEIGDDLPVETSFDLCVDALLGLGASRPPRGRIAEAIARLNALEAPCLSIDLPSGLDSTTGAMLGDAAVNADATLALLTLKPGLFTGAGRDHAGAIWFDDLGVPEPGEAATARLSWAGDLVAATVRRQHAHHKGSFGDVIVVGGAPGMHGAALLAAHGALGAGAGRTLVSLLDTQAAAGDATRPEWLWCASAWQPGHADLEHSTVVCGCGGGDAVRQALPALLARSARLVLDADALNALAADPALVPLLQARAAHGRATVLTPHPLEAARLLAVQTADIQRNRLSAAGALCDRCGTVVVLKGSGTVIAAPGRAPVVNSSGSAALATGGTGDVLAGWIGGLWAQAPFDAAPVSSAFDCAVASAWCHGAAAEGVVAPAVRARDLVDAMRTLAARAQRG